jgi:hypothetical protein
LEENFAGDLIHLVQGVGNNYFPPPDAFIQKSGKFLRTEKFFDKGKYLHPSIGIHRERK